MLSFDGLFAAAAVIPVDVVDVVDVVAVAAFSANGCCDRLWPDPI
jgi:hypothetical protein